MTKVRIKFEVTVEYEIIKDSYPAGATDEKCLAIDLANAEEDPFMLITDSADWKITGEIVPEVE